MTRNHANRVLLLARLAALLFAAMAMATPHADAQTCGNWLPSASLPDFGNAFTARTLAAFNGEMYALADGPANPRVFVLRAGLWQQLPWNDSSMGRILLFNTKGSIPATLTVRTTATTVSNQTYEYAIRTFDGTAWQLVASMSQTVSLTVPALTFGDMTLYNGAWYLGSVTNPASTLYRSSGTTISPLATTDAGSCTQVITTCIYLDPRSFLALQVGTNGLYIGGRFNSITPAGGSTIGATNLVRFDGTQFTALAAQPNGRVRGMLLDNTIAINNTGLVIWGEFTQVGALAASSIARWNSFTGVWNALGAGLNGSAAAVVQVQGVGINSINYVAVNAYPVGLADAQGCAKWTGSAWVNFGASTPETALWNPSNFTSALNFSGIVVAGSSINVNGSPRYSVSRWSGTSWDFVAAQQGTDGLSSAVCVYNAAVHVGGSFTRLDSVSAAHIARRNPTTNLYEPLGTGVDGPVLALSSFGGELIAGGTFTTAGGNPATNIAAWNGTSWRALGSGLDGAVRGLTTWNGSLVAVGSFRNSGATATGSAARWTGSAWVPIDATFNAADLYAAAVLGTTLHVGGPTGLRRFNGTAFEVVGNNVAGTVYALFPLLGSLYVGGDFVSVSSPALAYKRIARWNGTQWFTVGANANTDFFSGTVRSIFGTSSEVFAGGDFQTYPTGTTVITSNIARYDGVQWRRLDVDAPSARVLAGVVLGDRVWIAGEFTYVGSAAPVDSFGVGQWAKNPVFTVPPSPQAVCQTDGTGSAAFSVQTYGTVAPALRWQRNGSPLSDNLRIAGSATASLSISGITGADAGSYTCLATDACGGTTTSPAAALTVGCCAADFNNSGGLTIQDIFDFLNAWFAGDPRADFDHTNGLQVQDIFAFLNAWFAGC
jgi:hypothetical protein